MGFTFASSEQPARVRPVAVDTSRPSWELQRAKCLADSKPRLAERQVAKCEGCKMLGMRRETTAAYLAPL